MPKKKSAPITISVPIEKMHFVKRMKVEAAKQDVYFSDLMVDAIEAYVRKIK